jgi:rhodanese-related sulfurtransferase
MRTKKLTILAAGLMLLVAVGFGCTTTRSATQASPAKTEAADAWRFHDIVDVKFVQQYARMPRPDKVLIIDSRPRRAKFDKGYIPTAVSIPDSQFAKMTGQLPADKDTLLIFYCQGPT